MQASHILGSYSPESIVVVLANDKFSHTVSGFADGTFVEITRMVPHATLYTGADASNVRVVRAVKNCEVTLTLHQSSESNDILSQLLIRDEETRSGEDIFSITIKDLSGRTVASSGAAFIGTSPDIGFGTDVSERAWVLQAINMQIFEGGNGKFTTAGWDTINSLGETPNEIWSPANDSFTPVP